MARRSRNGANVGVERMPASCVPLGAQAVERGPPVPVAKRAIDSDGAGTDAGSLSMPWESVF